LINVFSRSLVTIALVMLIIFTGFEILTPTGEENINTHEITFKVDGMKCKMCSLTIKTALKKLDGVVNADVSYNDKQANVSYEDSKVSVVEMIKAIENTGNYKVSVIN